MQHHWVVPLVAALANSVICMLVLRGGLRRSITRTFAWMTLTTILWNLDIFALYYFEDFAAAELWSRVFRTGMCFGPVALLHVSLVQSESWGRGWKGALVASYVVAATLAIANLHGDLVAGLSRHAWGWYIQPTRLYALMTALVAVDLPLALQRVWHAYRHPSSPRQRVQAKFWFLAALVQTPFVVTNLLPIYGINVYPLGSLGNVLTMSIMAYAIARHRLMDVDYVVRKGVSFVLAATLVLVPGGLGIWALAGSMEWQEPGVVVCGAMALALLAVVLVPALQDAFETRVQRAFFPEYYDYRRRLRELASALVHVLDRHALVKRLGEELSDLFDVETCQLFVSDEGTRRLALAYPATAVATGDAVPEETVHALETLAGPVLASELEAVGSHAAALFRERGWEVVIPLRIKDRLTGFIGLGRNRDFRIFSGEDLQLLASVAAGASVALENATLSRQLRRSEAILERANRLSSLGLLAAGIAHEIRNPLVAVKTFLDLLPQRLDDQDFLNRFRDLSLGELRRVTDLIADLLALGKSKTAERRPVEVASTLEPVVRLMDSTARKRQVEVAATFAPRLPSVWADPDQLKQITLNLLLNAIESSAAGTHVSLAVRPAPGDGVVIEVRDEGPGIPAEQLETIFHPFFTTKETGTGLGLTLVHQMVVEHGGEISVESEVGRGSAFQVTIPGARLDLAPTGT
jgi:signal transduction histidine kinase